MKYEDIARVCHEANRAYCLSLGDTTQKPWDEAPEWQKKSAINGVEFHINNPQAGVAASHRNWMKEKLDNGWKWGPEKDESKKEHPCLTPFHRLPAAQQMKDFLFHNIVHTLK